ncbi:hypothetical protein BaRGS_00019013 [Batillaria attramentaria]|uniref:Uncharacterized protein n=1 Tax=Batillaria attramentaria TaxID=370345 RepID=A0ABD0KRZ1_9CAEN
MWSHLRRQFRNDVPNWHAPGKRPRLGWNLHNVLQSGLPSVSAIPQGGVLRTPGGSHRDYRNSHGGPP